VSTQITSESTCDATVSESEVVLVWLVHAEVFQLSDRVWLQVWPESEAPPAAAVVPPDGAIVPPIAVEPPPPGVLEFELPQA
jgi:hypothetical protein